MSCQNSINTTWDSYLDYEVIYTGLDTTFAGYTIKQGQNMQSIVQTLADGIRSVDTKEYYEPFILIDDAVEMDLTGSQLNARYPQAPVTGVIVNTDQGFQYTKISAINWKFEIIEIR